MTRDNKEVVSMTSIRMLCANLGGLIVSFGIPVFVTMISGSYTGEESPSATPWAGLTCYYNTENWSSVHVTWNEEKGRCIDLAVADNGSFSMPLEGAEIAVPDSVKSVHFKMEVRGRTYRYFYSFDGEKFTEIPVVLDSWKLSDDYVRGGGFFTGAFVGMNAIDITGTALPADFDYFSCKELD